MLAARNARLRRSSLCARRISACFCVVMSRLTAISRDALASAPANGETTTSHHFGVPPCVGQKPWKRPIRPAFASSTASLAAARSASAHSSSQDLPNSSAASVNSMLSMPPGLTNCMRASRPTTMMQSRPELRMSVLRACASRKVSSARRCSVRSRRILTKPSTAPPCARSGISSPLPQKWELSRRLCQRSSALRPWASACCISSRGAPLRQSSTVKMTSARWPRISASVHPRMRLAPSFQLVTRLSRSIVMMA